MSGFEQRLSNEDLVSLGFENLTHFTVGEQSKCELTRGRYLSAMCIGSCNESIWLGSKNKSGEVTDLICVHNYDYDGFITTKRLKDFLDWFNGGAEKALRGKHESNKNTL